MSISDKSEAKIFIETLIHWPKSYITGTDLEVLLDKTYDARHSIIKRAAKSGNLIKLQNDLYLIKSSLRKELPNSFELAQLIWGPSYISFESALSYHGWIPEAVRMIASACTKKGKQVLTPIAVFSFERIPSDGFAMGLHHKKEDGSYLIAEPWKAIADLVYARRKQWDTLRDLMEDLRLEEEQLKSSDKNLLNYLAMHYPSPRTRKILTKLYKEALCL